MGPHSQSSAVYIWNASEPLILGFACPALPLSREAAAHFQTWTHVSRLVHSWHASPAAETWCALCSKLQPLFLWPRSTSPSTITPESSQQDWSRPSEFNDQVRLSKNERLWPRSVDHMDLKETAKLNWVEDMFAIWLFFFFDPVSFQFFWAAKKASRAGSSAARRNWIAKKHPIFGPWKTLWLYRPRFGKFSSDNLAGLIKWTFLCDTLILCCPFGGPNRSLDPT